MFLRALAIFAALAVPLLMAVEAISTLHPQMTFIGPLAAILATLPIVFKASEARTQALFGAALAAMAAASTAELPELMRLTGSEDAMPTHDLREGPLPVTAEGYISVRGFLRDEWVVDEYATGGTRPDQNEAPRAVLLPLLGAAAPTEAAPGEAPSQPDIVAVDGLAGQVIIARVAPTRVQPSLTTLRGKLGPAPPEIVESLFVVQYQSAGANTAAGIPAVLLDTFDLPTRGQALTRTGLAVGTALLSFILLLLAVSDANATATKTERESLA